MPGATPYQAWPYPLPGEVLTRQSLQDLSEAMAFSLAAYDPDRLAVMQRPAGILGSTLNNVFTNGAASYMSWNVNHLDYWFGGGRAITSTQGPTLTTGLYLFTFSGNITATSGGTYTRIDVEFEVGGVRRCRRTLFPVGGGTWRITAPCRVSGSQQVRVRILTAGLAAATITIGRSYDESTPRLSWVRMTPN
jgi:hypothetical protein